MRVVAARDLLPLDRTPHAAVAFGNPYVGDAVRHPPVAGGIRRQGRRDADGQKKSGICYLTHDRSWAVQHGLNLCFKDVIQAGIKPHWVFSVDEMAINRPM